MRTVSLNNSSRCRLILAAYTQTLRVYGNDRFCFSILVIIVVSFMNVFWICCLIVLLSCCVSELTCKKKTPRQIQIFKFRDSASSSFVVDFLDCVHLSVFVSTSFCGFRTTWRGRHPFNSLSNINDITHGEWANNRRIQRLLLQDFEHLLLVCLQRKYWSNFKAIDSTCDGESNVWNGYFVAFFVAVLRHCFTHSQAYMFAH
jgi:hypothetical protein